MYSCTVSVNGIVHVVEASPATPLLQILRENLGLTGTKEACGRGECGACTILIGERAILSCIATIDDADGDITTIEGLADKSTDLRAAFADCGGFQCGFCTPGQIVRATALLQEAWPTGATAIEHFVRHRMSGNICRCTGYSGIVEAVVRVARSRGKIDEADA